MRLLLIFIVIISAISADTSAADKRPNLIFLFADDQNFDSLGCYGNQDVQTPNIDQLAADGLVFDRHYNTTAICMARRANVTSHLESIREIYDREIAGLKDAARAPYYQKYTTLFDRSTARDKKRALLPKKLAAAGK